MFYTLALSFVLVPSAKCQSCLVSNDVEVVFFPNGKILYADIFGKSPNVTNLAYKIYKNRITKNSEFSILSSTNAVWATNLLLGTSRDNLHLFVCESSTGQIDKWFHFEYTAAKHDESFLIYALFLVLGSTLTLTTQFLGNYFDSRRQLSSKRKIFWRALANLGDKVQSDWLTNTKRGVICVNLEELKKTEMECVFSKTDRNLFVEFDQIISNWASHETSGEQKQKLDELLEKIIRKS